MADTKVRVNANLNRMFSKPWSRRPPGAPPTPQARWNSRSADKLAAHRAVSAALRQGKLKRGQCEVCGSFRVDAHHDDYALPLSVRWLCRRHHLALHAESRRASK